jgi:hypothetical protein
MPADGRRRFGRSSIRNRHTRPASGRASAQAVAQERWIEAQTVADGFEVEEVSLDVDQNHALTSANRRRPRPLDAVAYF